MSDRESGSFSTGFTLGLLAGAAGYFIFGTHKGKQVREKLSVKWQDAKKLAADDWPEKAGTVGDVLKEIFAQISSSAENTTKQPKRKKKKTASKKKQFSGI